MIDDRLIFDVGMHTGEDTSYYLAKGFRVVAVEANSELCRQVAERYPEHIRSGELTIVNKAIALKPGKIRFYIGEKTIWSTIDPSLVARNEQRGFKSREAEAEATDFASLLRQYGTPRYAKIDIEGADWFCLQSLAETDLRPRFISIEADLRRFRAVRRQFKLFTGLGYDRFKPILQQTVKDQRCPQPAREGRYLDHRFEHGSSGLFGDELPGDWIDMRSAMRAYRRTVFDHLMAAEGGALTWLPEGRLRTALEKPFWRRWAWYDTHAMHRSAPGSS